MLMICSAAFVALLLDVRSQQPLFKKTRYNLGPVFTTSRYSRLLLLLLLPALISAPVSAQDTVCAEVKIEIVQELTMERQAFEAKLNIENTLADKTLRNIHVSVEFTDADGNAVIATSDPDNTTASFFIRTSKLEGIDDVAGSGSLDGGQSATATWLIIPAPGASDAVPSGKLYFVGATFNYTLEGIDDAIEVAPDSIYVKPMPLLSLDYFLPKDVFADNPLTTAIESPEPFTLGVRVKNNGTGTARHISIESAQPHIVENEQELLINFTLLNSYVQDQPINNSLLIEFGDIPAGESKMGRWTMETSLSGQFKDFSAEYSHADELGGQLTSLLEATNTHTLLKDVRVDVAGRDLVRDFLAYNAADPTRSITVYESNATETVVTDQSATASLSSSASAPTFSLEPTAGFVYAQIADPFGGTQQIQRVIRSDGKEMPLDNVWFSKSYNKATQTISHHFNLFDANSSGQYVIYLIDPDSIPRPPVLQFIPLKTTHEGKPLSFLVEASDPDQTIPTITLSDAPAGANLIDQGNGTAVFSWTPQVGQAGRYALQITASDGVLNATRNVVVVVNSGYDTDGDGLPDHWEMEHFGHLNNDGTGDADGDGVSDLMEHERQTDPNVADGPLAPRVIDPQIDALVATLEPELIIENSEYAGPFELVYVFELYADAGYTELVDAYYSQPEGAFGETVWQPKVLEENQHYFWRARAYDSYTYSPWVNSNFKTNIENALPPAPTVSYPQHNAAVFTQDLTLSVNNAIDPDGDALLYRFYLYDDAEATVLLSESELIAPPSPTHTSWSVSHALEEGRMYYWRAAVIDVAGQPVQSAIYGFHLGAAANTPPTAPLIQSPLMSARVSSLMPELRVIDAVDVNESAVLAYRFEVDTASSFDSPAKFESGLIMDDAQLPTFSWNVPAEASLAEDTLYYWRVQAVDSEGAESPWSFSEFFVNRVNTPPPVPVINNPGNDSQVITLTPQLALFAVTDTDRDRVDYEFDVYTDAALTHHIHHETSAAPEVVLPALADDRWYYWRARTKDETGENSAWTAVSRFFVNENNIDNAPEFTWITPQEGTEIVEGDTVTLRWQDSDPDSAARITLYYANNPEGVNRIRIAEAIAEDQDGDNDSLRWSSRELALGTYYFFAEIEDDTHFIGVAAEPVFSLTVRRFHAQPLIVESVAGPGNSKQLNNLVDKNYRSSWKYVPKSKRKPKPSEFIFDFGEQKRLDHIAIGFGNRRFVTHYHSIATSPDGHTWKTLVRKKTSSKHFWTTYSTFDDHNARYVRLTVHNTKKRRGKKQPKKSEKWRQRSIHEVVLKGGNPFQD